MKRVRDGSITLDDHDALSLEVARQVGTGLFLSRIDHVIYNHCVCNPFLIDLVINNDNQHGADSATRDSDPSKKFQTLSHMRWLMFPVVRFRRVSG